ncbi:hypothetical protein DL766_001572 [Monosporascus sp. MC13-8B]|uniref:Amino acid permease/ SLC12A domain-containing protein n=1 Tax=Monosporascus cannonballus TaxID=155416 RepID=A0ABY0HIY4_9PEZI|nr:hypothetical protein DL763_005950 [Monosporascus cannonballus]RYO94494.1 hypothetical protein DL762_000590 [Monosporascus cannonballus]RYP37262.1 hypothetical protein DL766_001572 [Monosporascus sp. MC13-8B]
MSSAMPGQRTKLGVVSGVYMPVVLNIISILMFLRFGSILGLIGLSGILGLLVIAYFVDFITTLSLSAIASNGEVKGGGAYYLISRSLGPEFGGSIGVLFYLSQVLNTALNVVGLIDCLKLNLGPLIPHGFWESYAMETCALVVCTALCLAGSAIFAKASNGLVVVLVIATLSIPVSTVTRHPFSDPDLGVELTGPSLRTLSSNLYPHASSQAYRGLETFREMFGVLFPATSGIFAGASMSGDLRNPSKAIPRGTLWAMLSTFILYLALARDKLLPGLTVFGQGTKRGDEPIFAVLLTYGIAQLALFADLNQIATFISMGYQMTFFVMNLACFLLKIGSAPNFRPAFHFFSWQTAFLGSVLSAAAMFFIDETYAASAISLLIFLFLLIHYASPPKHWGDVSQNLIYHQVRKYLLRLKPEHIKFWRPQIILLINDPRHHTRLIQFCNSMKKGALYILGHVIVTEDFISGIDEAKLQQSAWSRYISEYSRIKAFVQLTMSPSIEWGVRNLILSAGLGGMRPNIAVLGFYNMDELRRSWPRGHVPNGPSTPTTPRAPQKAEDKPARRRRGDTSARLLEGFLPTDEMRTEGMLSPTSYMTILEDLALRHRLNVAVGIGFQALETPQRDGSNTKKFIDLWPIQMSAEITSGEKSVLTSNFDTYTLILQLGYVLFSVPAWKKAFRLRVLVFVEYESEIEDERRRLKALLEKLRIEAQIVVFALASGRLSTYEYIINGDTSRSDTAYIVNELLKDDEWWKELQCLRNEAAEISRSQELASLGAMLEETRRRNSDPHLGEEDGLSRRFSVQDLLELPKNPTVSTISKLGVNFGIHTHRLSPVAFPGPDQGDSAYSDDSDSESTSSSDADFNYAASLANGCSAEDSNVSRRQSVSALARHRKSVGDIMMRQSTPTESAPLMRNHPARSRTTTPSGYGTIRSEPTQPTPERLPPSTPIDPPKRTASSMPLLRTVAESGETSAIGTAPPAAAPSRPPLSRHSSASRFTSNLTPDMKITVEEESGPRLQFSEPGSSSAAAKIERPQLSRNSSMRKFSSRPVPETRVEDEEGAGPRLTFAGPEGEPQTPRTPLSRRNSAARGGAGGVSEPISSTGDVHLDIPELLESYRFSGTRHRSDEGDGSSYSTQGLPLSFNDLPSRAQHLILNELMRRNSGDGGAAVLLSTLPIPAEGTCRSEDDSLRYLSDIEVLCHDLPPVLLVLSNNMTVTVSL